MSRKMISEAVGYVDEKYVLEAMELSYRDACPIDRDEEGIIPIRGKRHLGRAGKIALVAAVAAAILAMTAFAVSVLGGRVELAYINVDGQMISGPVTITSEDGPVKLGSWYPEGIPEGYEITDSSLATDNHSMCFENAAGARVVFVYNRARYVEDETASDEIMPGTLLFGVKEQQWVRIGNADGILYLHTNGGRHLYWADEERNIGFKLYTTDPDIDIVELALSVEERQELFVPTDRPLAEEALAQIGDYRPSMLPEGFEFYCTNGYPQNGDNESGYAGYAYVTHSFMDSEGVVIHLRVENDWDASASAETMRDLHINAYMGDYLCTTFRVNGCPAGLVENMDGTPCFLLWTDGKEKLVFRLEAENLTSEELIAVAESVALVE